MHKAIILLSSFTAISLLAESSVIDLSPISVVGTGIEESVLEQPLSIATKGEKEIKLDQVIFQKDLLNSLAGVRIEQTGSVIGHTTAIRMPSGTSAYYLFMQDGIPTQSSGFFNHNGLAYSTFQTASSVEVLKGAGTALYGSDAVAAVINVESLKKPSKEKEIAVKGMVGSYGYASGSLEMSDTVDEKSSYRASAGYMHSDGWRDHTTTDRIEANVRYEYIINGDNDIKVLFNTSTTDAEQADSFNNYSNIENSSKAASDDSKYFDALDSTDISRHFDYARLSLEWNNYSYDALEISLTPYVRYNRNQYVATWKSDLPKNDNELMTVGLLNRNTYDASWGRVIGGFDTEYTQSSLEYSAYDTGALNYNYDVSYMAIAPYIHTEYDITKMLMLTAGLRYDYNHYDYTNNLQGDSSLGKYFRPASRTDSFSHFSPKLSLNYMANEDTNVYLRYANGFRIPQASRLYSMSTGYETVNVDPETSNTYEVGIKRQVNNKSYVELTTYYMTIDDTITRYNNPITDDYYYDNGGSTIHKGIEATARVQLNDDWATRIAYSYAKHTYDNHVTFGNTEIAAAPNHTANTRLVYTPSYMNGLTVMGEWQYVGTYWMNDDHDKAYAGYSIGNLKADYIYNKDISFFAKITNITDEKYAVSASYTSSFGGKSDYNPADPRQFYVGLEYKW